MIAKFGEQTHCYLTGRTIDLKEPKSYVFDHVVPVSRGGGQGIENLGIATREANFGKGDLMVEDFIHLCKEVLEHNGYKVKKWK